MATQGQRPAARRRNSARVLLIALLAAGTLAVSGCGRLDKDAVSTELDGIGSATAEGMLVAEEAARSRAPANFIEIRTAELSKVARNASDALSQTPTEQGFQDAADRGAQIGDRASELLDSLHSDPGNSGLAQSVVERLRALHREVGDVQGSL